MFGAGLPFEKAMNLLRAAMATHDRGQSIGCHLNNAKVERIKNI